MAAVQVSRLLRLALEAQFVALFNTALAVACTEFEIEPIVINFAQQVEGLPQNFARGDWTLEQASRLLGLDLPAMAMWTGEGRNEHIEMPRTWSGPVAVYWRFWLFSNGIQREGLVTSREAVEAAMIATLDPELPGLGYRGDLEWKALDGIELHNEDDSHFGWAQQVTYSASFEVNV